jgi:hypothetical protein
VRYRCPHRPSATRTTIVCFRSKFALPRNLFVRSQGTQEGRPSIEDGDADKYAAMKAAKHHVRRIARELSWRQRNGRFFRNRGRRIPLDGPALGVTLARQNR